MRLCFPLMILALVACGPTPPPSTPDGGGKEPTTDSGVPDDVQPATGEEGGACFGNGACNAGLICQDDVCVAETAEPEQGAEGGACYGNGTCNTELVCQNDVCVAETVAPEQGAEGGACYGNGTCNPGLVCQDDVCIDGSGPQQGTEGGACYANGTCNGGLTCVDDVCEPETPSGTPPTITSFTATPSTIDSGQFSVLSWSTSTADSCSLNQAIGGVNTNGTRQVTPTETTTYELTCDNSDGAVTAQVTITVNPPVQIVSFTANDNAPSTIIDHGDSVTLAWTTANATSCSIDGGIGAVQLTGTTTVSPTSDSTYVLTCQGTGGPATAEVSVTVNPPVEVLSFTANGASGETTIDSGNSATLAWTTENATSCELNDGLGAISVPTGGQRIVTPTTDTTYTLTCQGVAGPDTATVTVRVNPPVAILSFTATPTTIDYGQFSVLSWTTANAASCSISSGIGSVSPSGTTNVSPTATTTYTLTCQGVQGPVSAQVTVTVNPPVRILSFTASAQAADFLSNVTLTWTTENATGCELDNGIGTVNVTGNRAVTIEDLPGAIAVYTLTCQGVAGPVNDTVEVDVNNIVHTGNITICGADPAGTCTPQQTLARLQAVNTIQGDLEINGEVSSGVFSLPKLVSVTGRIRFRDADTVNAIDLPNLRSVGGELSFSNNYTDGNTGYYDYISIPRLESVGGTFSIFASNPLEVDASSLLSIGGSFNYLHNYRRCSALNFASLESVGNRWNFFNNRVESYVDAFPALQSIGENVYVSVESGALDPDVESAFADVSVVGTTTLEGATTDGCPCPAGECQ